jgi:DNA-binding XRE family transcriptional regulator
MHLPVDMDIMVDGLPLMSVQKIDCNTAVLNSTAGHAARKLPKLPSEAELVERWKNWRADRGISMARAATLAGVDRKVINRVESGERAAMASTTYRAMLDIVGLPK